MRFQGYILERTAFTGAGGPESYQAYGYKKSRSAGVEIEKAKQTVLDNCRDIYNFYVKNPDSLIFRGTPSSELYKITDPASVSKERASAYADYNYYTLLMNNLPSWAGYPKREIICTTSFEKALDYRRVYVVFPYDDAKVGVCPDEDIFTSFKIRSLRALNTIINSMVDYVVHKKEIKSWAALEKFLRKIDKPCMADFLKNYDDDFTKTDAVEMYNIWQAPYNTLYDFFNDYYLNPQKNKFKVVSNFFNITKFPKNREVWTDSKCLLVYEPYFEKFMAHIVDII